MQSYKKTYCKAFGIDADNKTSFVQSEISGDKAVDIHHLVNREDRIENLMALTREEHSDYGEIKYVMSNLLEIHRKHLLLNDIPFDNKWFEFYIKKYEPYFQEAIKEINERKI